MAGNRNRISGRDHFRKDDTKILSILSLDYLRLNIRQIVPFFPLLSVFEQTFFNRKSCSPKEGNLRFVTFNKNVRRPQFGRKEHGKDYRYLYSRNLRVTVTTRSPEMACNIFLSISILVFKVCREVAYSLFWNS